MIEQIWNKKIVAVVDMNEQDIADTHKPIPLILEMSWNAYIGFYYDLIFQFFEMYAPFPIRRNQFNLSIGEGNILLQQSDIVFHILEKHQISLAQPLYLKCNFRSQIQLPQIDLRRHYKNNLKASTAIRYGKYGASILMVQMSISNFQNLVNSFQNGNYQQFLGSSNFQSDDLGYLFLIHRADKIAVKFLFEDVAIQRSAEKNISFQEFIKNTFGEQTMIKLKFRLHLVPLQSLDIKMSELEKYCHPDGYLYIHI